MRGEAEVPGRVAGEDLGAGEAGPRPADLLAEREDLPAGGDGP